MATDTTGSDLQNLTLGEDIFLVSPPTGHVLGLPGAGGVGDGAAILALDQAKGRPSYERWRIEAVDDDYLKVVSIHSGLALTVAEASQSNGAPIVQEAWRSADNQKWQAREDSQGIITLTAKHSNKVLDLAFNSPYTAAAIIQWDYAGGENQSWIPQPVR